MEKNIIVRARGAFRFPASFFTARGLEESRARRAAALFLVPLLVFLFYLSFMKGVKASFGGDYARFMHFVDVRLTNFDQVYWDVNPPLLFKNSDFEKGTLENWTPEGEAFLYQPVREENLKANERPFFMNAQGLHFIGTYDKFGGVSQGDAPDGRLASSFFIIKEDKIGFLLGGGRTETEHGFGRQAAALEVDGRVVREDTGRNLERMNLRVWDVRRWVGREARIVLIDDPSERPFFRHLNADWFHYYRTNEIRRSLPSEEGGYDGQFYYFLAHDPLLDRVKDDPRRALLFLDHPAYRAGRVGFPLLVRLFSFGDAARFPAVMVWLVVLSHFAGAFFFLKIILFYKKSPLWAFLYVLVPGFHLSLYFGLPESLCLAFVLGGLYFYLRRRMLPAVLLLAAAILVREMGLAAAAVAAGYELFRRRDIKAALWLGSSVLPYAVWKAFLTARLFGLYGWETFFHRGDVLTLPFAGLAELLRNVSAGSYQADLVPTAVFYAFLLGLAAIFAVFLAFRTPNVFTLAAALYVLAAVSLNYAKMWVDMSNGIRASYEIFVFLILAFVSQEKPVKPGLKFGLLGFYAAVLVFSAFVLYTGRFFRGVFG
ncbi:MAG: hypothetical protein JW747_00140 [Candidatus Aminicenantes bacterium]|nr:hypothetical protein [Candidatus Aminicenantes bacterium]